jgi:starvation-inducible DNA-binding protein
LVFILKKGDVMNKNVLLIYTMLLYMSIFLAFEAIQGVQSMETRIGLKADVVKNNAAILNMLLSDEYVLLTKLLNYHWNVTGPFFGPLHKLFNDQYDEVFKMVDEVAERVRSIGGVAFGTLREFSDNSRLKENPGHIPSTNEMIADLVRAHEAIIVAMRQAIPDVEEQEDFGTMDFLTGLMEKHEKMAWFLRAHLQERPM